jgi:hypothetical protein
MAIRSIPTTTNVYETADGQRFPTYNAALNHENSVASKMRQAASAKETAKAKLKTALEGMKKGEYQYIPPEVITMVTNISFEHPRTVAKYLLEYVRKTEQLGVKADGGKVTKTFRA